MCLQSPTKHRQTKITVYQKNFLSHRCVLFCVQIEVIRGLAVLKKATAIVNKQFGLDAKLADVIVEASDEVPVYYYYYYQVSFSLQMVSFYYCLIAFYVSQFIFLYAVVYILKIY